MNTLEFIESYFDGSLGTTEREAFEQRVQTDENFASEVAFFIAARDELQQTLREQKIAAWKAVEDAHGQAAVPIGAPVRSMAGWKKMLRYAAAALVIGMGIWIGIRPAETSTYEIADEYVSKELSTLSQTMDGGQDSLQQGIALYNNKQYAEAAIIFNELYQRDTSNAQALKFSGLASLAQGEYDVALQKFEALAAKQHLFANPGNFYSALLLMKRNAAGDKEKARQLLEKVVAEHQEGSAMAAKWLESF